MSDKSIILEELVDCIHFWLSIINDSGIDKYIKVEKCSELDFNQTFLYMIDCLSNIGISLGDNVFDISSIFDFMSFLLMIAETLGFTEEEIIEAYYKKRDINFKRQQEGY